MRQVARFSLIIFIIFAIPGLAIAGSATLHWQPNTESDLAGYRIYYGTSSRSYGPYISVGKNTTSYTLNNLTEGQTYYFAVTAVDTSGNESAYSQEVSKTIASETTSSIPLPATGSYGMIKGGDQSHVNEVRFSFGGKPGNLRLSYRVWDVDVRKEVQIILNGHVLGYAPVTGNNKWGRTHTIVLPDEYVNDSTPNILRFNNTYNPPKRYWWGVGDVSIVGISTFGIPLPATGSYGMIKGGDQSHVNEVRFSFDGKPGNLRLSYRVWDVDVRKEVQIILNGHVLGYAPVTGNNKWGRTHTIVLPDEYVNDSTPNILRFNNTYNPPKRYWWGVGQVSVK